MKKMYSFSFKAISVLIAVSVLLSTVMIGFSMTANSDSSVSNIWKGDVAEKIAVGDGSEKSPFEITNGAELAFMVKSGDQSGKYFILKNDIYLNDVSKSDWMSNNPNTWYNRNDINKVAFQGNFNGNNHTIYGLYYNSNNYSGLFPEAKNVTISDLTLSESSITSSWVASGLIGYAPGKVTINRCIVDDTVTIKCTDTSSPNDAVAAGFVGYGDPKVYIDNSAVTAKITSSNTKVGAFIGNCWGNTVADRKITNSFSAVNAPMTGHKSNAITVENCYNVGTEVLSYTGTVNKISSADLMKGSAAKTNMPKLNWKTWKTTDSYPVIRVNDPNGTKGEVWAGGMAEKYAGGTGLKDDPYLIETPEQLARMVGYDVLTEFDGKIENNSSDKYYKLTADIYLNDVSDKKWYQADGLNKWYSSDVSRFCGNFDGNGYTIYGLYTDSNAQYGGLFSVADAWTQDRYFENITISHSYLVTSYGTKDSSAFVGAIAGRIYSGNNKTVYFNNCFVTDTVIFSESSASTYWGGLVGFAQPSDTSFYSLTGCAILAKVHTNAAFTGAESSAGTVTVSNSFTNNSKWVNGNKASLTDCYLSIDIATIKGKDAKTNMPNLAWDYIWKTTDDGYPTYYSRDYDLNGTVGGVWSGLTALDYAGGSGSENDPYKIATAEQFIKMLKDSNNEGQHYELIADINFNDVSKEDWKEDAKKYSAISNRFKGYFDGKGNTIRGIYFDGTSNNIALFGIADNAIIENVILDDSYIKSTGYGVGGIVGQAINKVELNECYVGENVYIESTLETNDGGAGGLVGYGGYEIKVNGSAFLGTVVAPKNAGAIFGNCWGKKANGTSSLIVTNTFSTADVKFCSKQDLASESDNNYSVHSGNNNAVIVVDSDKLKGEEAMETMSGLDWGRLWKTTEDDYPVCQFTDDAGSPEGIWSGNIAEEYAGGSGKKSDPYIIENGEQLALMVVDVENSGKYYKLDADIKLNDTSAKRWRYVARQWIWSSNIFKGNFDGDGHKITGLYYNGTKSKVGLVAYAADAVITGVIIDEAYLHSTGYGVGAIVGDANSGSVTLKECYIGEKVDIESTFDLDDNAGAGGIVGYGGAAITVEGSAFLGKVKAPKNTGAILGNCWGKDENGSSAILIRNSFTTSDLRLCVKQSLNHASDNNYSVSSDEEIGVVSVELSKMEGKDANANMPKLDWGRFWKVNDSGYPTSRFGEIDEVSGVWSGETATEYAGGSGTKEDPYLISNGEELRLMVTDTDTQGKYYKLTADIKLNDTTDSDWILKAKQWDWNENKFGGNIDGDGHTISGLYYNGTRSKVGLFCYAIDASVSNLTIDDSYMSSLGYAVSSIVGDANGGLISLNRCVVGEDVYLESEFDADSNAGAGGLVGYGGAAITVTASAFLGEVKAPDNAGSIFGNCWGKDETGASALVIKYSYSPSALPFCSKQALSYASDNNYSANEEDQTGVIYIEAEKMKGEDAIDNMPALDWGRYWQVSESGYPICRIGDSEKVDNVWSGEVATEYAGGSGTKEDPYLITNGEELALMVLDTESEGKFYKQTTDIYLNDITKEKWKSTAKQWIWTDNIFKGTFDGDTNSIRGLYYNGTKSKIGLFCYVADAIIKRVVLDDLYIVSKGYATGSIVGDANKGTVDILECYVGENSYVESKFDADNNVGAGGLIGYGGAEITIIGSAFLGEVKAPDNLGAMLGNCWTSAIVKNSFATPSVKYCTKRDLSTESSANYGTGKESENGVISIRVNAMKGEKARKTMKNLNWFRSWKTTESGYPVLNVGEYEGVSGEVWTGRIATKFAGGSGTKKDPYLISTGEQLAYLLENIMDSKGNYYKLTGDIYLNDVNNPNWKNENPRPWFYASTARYGNFNGHFNGDGHVIHGLYLDVVQTSSVIYAGLFPTVSDGTIVEKTGLSNAHLKATTDNYEWQSYVAGFTGLVFFNKSDEETDINNIARFSQCFGDSTVVLEGRYVGGIVSGGPRPCNIDNCYFIGQVIGERVGAIIGNTWNDLEGGTVTKSYGATMAEDIFCGGKSGVQNSATPFNYVDNYTNATGSVSGHATQIGLLMMRGASAKKNMPALDFKNVWHALENGTPVLKIFGTTDKYSNTSEPEPIEISFVSNGGSVCENMYGNPEEKLTLPVPTKEGYKFDGWYVYRELDIEYTIDYFPYFDQILYAKWVPLGIMQNFENYPNTMYDLGWDYEYYRPGTIGYDAKNVHGGMASMHRIGLDNSDSDVLINYEEMLTVGKKYNITFFVTTDTQDTSVKLSLVHEKWPDVYTSDLGVETMKELTAMNPGEWHKIEYTFIARTKWIAIRTSGGASIYIDDFMAIADSDKIYDIEELPEETPEETPSAPSDTSSDSSNENTSSDPSDTSSNVSSTPSDTSSGNTSTETPSIPTDESANNQGENVQSEVPSLPPEDFFGNNQMEIPIIDDPTLNVPQIENMNSQENNGILVIMPEENEPKKVIKKRIWKKKKPSTKKNNDVAWFVGGASGLVVLLGATLYAIFYMKKRKFKKR